MSILWRGKKLICGKPITFTEYSCDETTIYVREGVLSKREEQVSLYRIIDISMQQSFIDRLFNQGTIILNTTDVNNRIFEIKSVANPSKVRNLINKRVEAIRSERVIRTHEYYSPVDYDRNDYENDGFSEDEYY